MRLYTLSVCLILSVTGISVVQAAQPIAADGMGLSKGSVFDTPTPKVYNYKGAQPGENKRILFLLNKFIGIMLCIS